MQRSQRLSVSDCFDVSCLFCDSFTFSTHETCAIHCVRLSWIWENRTRRRLCSLGPVLRCPLGSKWLLVDVLLEVELSAFLACYSRRTLKICLNISKIESIQKQNPNNFKHFEINKSRALASKSLTRSKEVHQLNPISFAGFDRFHQRRWERDWGPS